MKIKITFCLLAAALLPACQTTSKHTSAIRHETVDYKSGRFANVSRQSQIAPPAEGPAESLSPAPPSEGPLEDMTHNPAVVPSPLLRDSAAASP